MTYPDNASFDIYAHMIRWFDHYLKRRRHEWGGEGLAGEVFCDGGQLASAARPATSGAPPKDWPVPVKITPYFLQANLGLDIRSDQCAIWATTYLKRPCPSR